jgi:hypothetical protein
VDSLPSLFSPNSSMKSGIGLKFGTESGNDGYALALCASPENGYTIYNPSHRKQFPTIALPSVNVSLIALQCH